MLDDVKAQKRTTFPVDVTGVRSLGRGTALVLDSEQLLALRADLAHRWSPWLTRQDAQRYSPHVTVQNKVEPAQARGLVEELAAAFEPWQLTATGVHVWRYLGGPWELIETVHFRG